MTIKVTRPPKAEITRCIARFKDLTRNEGGLPDADLEGYKRTFLNVVGFKPPPGSGAVQRVFSPVPDNMRAYISHLQPGFGMAFVQAAAGNGVMMHVHDTNETFLVLEGNWRMSWEGDKGDESVELEKYDVISFPPNVQRQFHCLSVPTGVEKGMILGVIGGDQPSVEYSPESVKELIKAGKLELQT
jgi:mannose-6-phosphate isomerase-like protein (cupin superfamily)